MSDNAANSSTTSADRAIDKAAVGPTTNGGVKLPAAEASSKAMHPVGTNGGTKSVLSGDACWFKPRDDTTPTIRYLQRDSVEDHAVAPIVVASSVALPDSVNGNGEAKGKGKAVQEPIGTRGATFVASHPQVFYTSDVGPNCSIPGGHYLSVASLAGKEISGVMRTLHLDFKWNVKVLGSHAPQDQGSHDVVALHLCFDDVRDAANAIKEVEIVNPVLEVKYISQPEYAASKPEYGPHDQSNYYDGQVIFVCQFNGVTADFPDATVALEGQIRKLADNYGEVLAFSHHAGEGGNVEYRVEYYKIRVAKQVVTTVTPINPVKICGWFVVAKLMVMLGTPPGSAHRSMTIDSGFCTPQNGVPDQAIHQYTSPTGRTAWRVDSSGKHVALAPPRPVARVKTGAAGPFPAIGQTRSQSEPMLMLPPNGFPGYEPQGPRNASWSIPSSSFQLPCRGGPPQIPEYRAAKDSPMAINMPNGMRLPMLRHIPPTQHILSRTRFIPDGPNKIYPEKILNGTDVRTSVMVRNLPNDMTLNTLKDILDGVCFGRYDFSYLRIDFNNNKNVGYGFVNFVEATDILPLYRSYYGQPWIFNGYRRKSPRIADISYATIQGLDCLVEKLRNSSVMDENTDFRPKMWWTFRSAIRDDLVGTERDFPPVNNFSKKARSRENATQIGLYSTGSRSRRAQGHQSQFDRGTTAQMQEEAGYYLGPLHANSHLAAPGPNSMMASSSGNMMAPGSSNMAVPGPNGMITPGQMNTMSQQHALVPIPGAIGFYPGSVYEPLAPGPRAYGPMAPMQSQYPVTNGFMQGRPVAGPPYIGFTPYNTPNDNFYPQAYVRQPTWGNIDQMIAGPGPHQGHGSSYHAAYGHNDVMAIPEETGDWQLVSAMPVIAEPHCAQADGTDQYGHAKQPNDVECREHSEQDKLESKPPPSTDGHN